jgi:hypothetical protein
MTVALRNGGADRPPPARESGTFAPGGTRSPSGSAPAPSLPRGRRGRRERPRGLVNIAPGESPRHGTHDRMPRRLEVSGGVAVRRIVAAPDVATRPTFPQRHPDRPLSGAFLASGRSRRREIRCRQCLQMLTGCRHLFPPRLDASRVQPQTRRLASLASYAKGLDERAKLSSLTIADPRCERSGCAP